MDWPGKCEECNGEKEVPIGYTLSVEVTPYEASQIADGEYIKRKVPCGACNGTGERGLTADEAAEYLRVYPDGYIMSDPFGVEWDDFNKLWFVFGGQIPSYPGNDITKGGKTLTEALSAAARAVYERGKE